MGSSSASPASWPCCSARRGDGHALGSSPKPGTLRPRGVVQALLMTPTPPSRWRTTTRRQVATLARLRARQHIHWQSQRAVMTPVQVPHQVQLQTSAGAQRRLWKRFCCHHYLGHCTPQVDNQMRHTEHLLGCPISRPSQSPLPNGAKVPAATCPQCGGEDLSSYFKTSQVQLFREGSVLVETI